jgi:ABC-type nitrate/sulfonate/bicarbonate transport system ATPase subunit
LGTYDIEVKNVSCVFPARHATKRSGEYLAVRAINLSISPGEFFCLLGPSGCGKSTILRMIAGFLPPTAGQILLSGKPIRGPGIDRGVVFQGDAAIFNWLTVEENISFGPRMQRISEDKYRRIVAENIRLVGLEGFEQYQPHQLSGGMRQRLQIARVLANDPGILLMDEPFGALDAQTREIMQQELSRIWNSRKKTVLFITHDIDEALVLGDRIAIMTAGPAATIKSLLSIDLPRPRELNEALLRLRRDVKAAIEQEVTKAMRQVP